MKQDNKYVNQLTTSDFRDISDMDIATASIHFYHVYTSVYTGCLNAYISGMYIFLKIHEYENMNEFFI